MSSMAQAYKGEGVTGMECKGVVVWSVTVRSMEEEKDTCQCCTESITHQCHRLIGC